jgi:hypothetical protein
MATKRKDEEVTQQIRVGREALDEALRDNTEALRRLRSSIPAANNDGEDELEPDPAPPPDPSEEGTKP